MHFTYNDLEANLINWAKNQEDIYAILLIGSRARTFRPHDECSDLDIILYTPNDKKYANQDQWLRELGPFWCSHLDHTHLGEPEQFAIYEEAIKLDVLLTHIDHSSSLQSCFDDSPHHMVLKQGFKVLLDKTSSQGEVHLPHLPTPDTSPNQIGFKNEISETLFAAIKATRFLKRGDPDQFRASSILSGSMRRHLLVMLEWEAMSQSTQPTWYDGRFINEWADPDTVRLFPQIFGAYHIHDQKLALQTFIQVYLNLIKKVSQGFNLTIPETEIFPIIAWLMDNLT